MKRMTSESVIVMLGLFLAFLVTFGADLIAQYNTPAAPQYSDGIRPVSIATVGAPSKPISIAGADIVLYNNENKLHFTPAAPGTLMLCTTINPDRSNPARVTDGNAIQKCGSLQWLRTMLEGSK